LHATIKEKLVLPVDDGALIFVTWAYLDGLSAAAKHRPRAVARSLQHLLLYLGTQAESFADTTHAFYRMEVASQHMLWPSVFVPSLQSRHQFHTAALHESCTQARAHTAVARIMHAMSASSIFQKIVSRCLTIAYRLCRYAGAMARMTDYIFENRFAPVGLRSAWLCLRSALVLGSLAANMV
jgi:hypothetical protein